MQLRQILVVIFFFLVVQLFSVEDENIDHLINELSTTKDDTLKVNILIKLSAITSWSDIKASEQYAKQALDLSRKISYIKGLAYSNFQLAKIYADSDFDFAESLVLESLDFAIAVNDSMLMARVYNILGNLKSNLNHNNDALTYYNKSLGIYLRANQDSSAAAIYNNLGIMYADMYRDSLAIEYYLKAAEINIKTKNYLWLAINYQNIGSDFFKIAKLKEGYDYLQQSLKLANEHNFNRLYPWIYNNFSYYFLLIENYKESLEYAEKALLFARKQTNLLQELDALVRLKDIYDKMSDIKKTNYYLKQIIATNDSIYKHSRLKELDLLELRFKFEEEQKQQKLEKALLEAKHYRKESTYLLIILLSGLIIFSFLILYIIQRNRVRRKTLEQKNTLLEKEKLSGALEFKNKELTTNVMYLLKKNEFISAISDKLKNINFDSINKNNDAIDRIISELDKSISEDNWSDFEVRFQEVHVGFYNKLSKKYHDLTPNELRLCAFLRLNMTSKEIADITLQSADSIKTARYRLRKKLGIGREDNLVTFLTKF